MFTKEDSTYDSNFFLLTLLDAQQPVFVLLLLYISCTRPHNPRQRVHPPTPACTSTDERRQTSHAHTNTTHTHTHTQTPHAHTQTSHAHTQTPHAHAKTPRARATTLRKKPTIFLHRMIELKKL